MTKKMEIALSRFIKKAGENWKERLLNCIHDEEENGNVEENLEQEFDDLCNLLKEILMTEDADTLQFVKDKFSGELTVYHALEKYVKEDMFAFYYTAVLREKAKESIDDTLQLIEDFYQNIIIRTNPHFFEQYKRLGFASEAAMKKTVFVLDSMTQFVIEKNYTQAAAAEMLEDLTRLDRTICLYIAQKIEDNFQSLQMKVLLQKLTKANS